MSVFDFGFTDTTLKEMCTFIYYRSGEFSGAGADSKSDGGGGGIPKTISIPNSKRRRLATAYLPYPIIPDIKLPCIPIAPPAIMLCPVLTVATEFQLDVEPDFAEETIGLGMVPSVGFTLRAALDLNIGVGVIYAQIELAVQVDVVSLSLPFDIGLDFKNSFDFLPILVSIFECSS